MKLVILTGMSGAGKRVQHKMMEDIGFYCVDNLPIPLIEKLYRVGRFKKYRASEGCCGCGYPKRTGIGRFAGYS